MICLTKNNYFPQYQRAHPIFLKKPLISLNLLPEDLLHRVLGWTETQIDPMPWNVLERCEHHAWLHPSHCSPPMDLPNFQHLLPLDFPKLRCFEVFEDFSSPDSKKSTAPAGDSAGSWSLRWRMPIPAPSARYRRDFLGTQGSQEPREPW